MSEQPKAWEWYNTREVPAEKIHEMNDRPTPETDAVERMAFAQEYMVPTSFARKLERDRDEAREELARIQALLLDPHAVFLNFLHGKIAKLDWDKLEHIHGPHPAGVERDEVRNKMADALQEVDLRTLDYERMKQERDEARKLCSELVDLVAYGLGQSGEPWSLDAMRQATDAIQKVKQMGTLPTD